jgi:hypothetical protein
MWVDLDMKPETIWLPVEAELPVRAKGQLQAKAHADRFLGNSGNRTLFLAPRKSYIRFAILLRRSTESTRSENADKFQKTCKPLTLIHMDNARAHTAKATQEKSDVSRFKRTSQPPYSPDIVSSDFFIFGWLKAQFEQRE